MRFLEALEKAPDMVEESIALCRRAKGEFNNVLVSGMGGSGITGSIMQEFLYEKIDKPIIVNKGPFIPGFCGKRTLHVVISYSGNTRETLDAFARGLAKGCRTVCITSGGELSAKAEDLIGVHSGLLPRQALFCMLVPALGLFYDVPDEVTRWLRETRDEAEKENSDARKLARRIGERTPLIYGSYPFSSLALRFKQQVNENCKGRAFCNYLPEMNHNEIESFHNNFRDFAAVSIGGGFERSLDIMRERCDVMKMELKGNSDIERLFRALYIIDFVTYYMSELRGIDPAEMPNIDSLKKMA
jgi:glucose/mannose-6-phosphate isomerase